MPQGGRYIECDKCRKSTFSLNLPWPFDTNLIAAAKEAGWRIICEPDVNYVEDTCPACVALEGNFRPVGEPIAVPAKPLSVMENYEALMKCADVMLPSRYRKV